MIDHLDVVVGLSAPMIWKIF